VVLSNYTEAGNSQPTNWYKWTGPNPFSNALSTACIQFEYLFLHTDASFLTDPHFLSIFILGVSYRIVKPHHYVALATIKNLDAALEAAAPTELYCIESQLFKTRYHKVWAFFFRFLFTLYSCKCEKE
jgi:hypothetical protein